MTDSSSSLPDPFWAPAADAVLQPPTFPPPPDPVLAPPWLPPPWDQAPPPPPPPAPAPEPPAAAAPATPRRRTKSSSAPAPARQAPVHRPPVSQPGTDPRARTRQRSRRGLWIGIPIFLAVCAPALTNAARSLTDAIRDATAPDTVASVPAPSTRAVAAVPSLSYPQPTITVVQKMLTAFDLPVGTAVLASEGANQWTMAVVDVAWVPGPCDDTYRDAGPVVVLGIRYDVLAGQVMSVPSLEFVYQDSTGIKHTPSLVSGCDKPLVSALMASAGETREAVLVFEDPTGLGGEVTYDPSLVDLGSWTIPARPA